MVRNRQSQAKMQNPNRILVGTIGALITIIVALLMIPILVDLSQNLSTEVYIWRLADDGYVCYAQANNGIYGSMNIYSGTQTVTINTNGVYHGVMGFSPGSVSRWAVFSGSQVDANITSEADNTVLRIVTSGSHGMTTGNLVTLSNMNNAGHNAPTEVTVIDDVTFDCDNITYVAGAGVSAGVVDMPSYLEAGIGVDGMHSVCFSISGLTPEKNKVYKLEIWRDATEIDTIVAEELGEKNNINSLGSSGFIYLAGGDKVWLAVENNTDTTNYEIRHGSVVLHRL